MKILHVVPSFAPCFSAGGVVNASYQIAKKQVEMGHDVTVYTTDNCKNRLHLKKHYNVNLDGIRVFYFKNISNRFKNIFTIDTPIKLPKKLNKNISKFDIIHIHEHRHSLSLIAAHYAKKYNVPYVLQSHGSVLPFFQKERLKKVFDKMWGFNILYNAEKLFALTSVEKEQYLKMGVLKDKIEIVPLGINLDDFKDLPTYGLFREKYDISFSDKLLLFLGRIHEIKGLDLLIKVMDILKNENIKLAIVGEDYGFKNHLKKMIDSYSLHDKVIFTGPLYGDSKKEALTDCDLFLMASKYESFTTSGLEALASSKPLVLTKNNHICSWVNENVGLCCDYDKNKLAEAINIILNNDELYDTFSKNGQEIIKEKYNWDIIVDDIIKIYEKIIS